MTKSKTKNTNVLLTIPPSWYLVLVVGLAARLVFLDGSFWMDEAAQALQSVRPLIEQHRISADFQPPMMHYIVHLLSQFSQAEAWLRLASVVPGMGMILISMDLVRRYSLKYSWIAGLFLALSPFHVFFSQELRPYSLAAFWITLGVWFGVRFTQSKARFDLVGWAVCQLGGWLSMYLVPFFTLAQLLWLIRRTSQPRRIVQTLTITMLPFLIWLPFLLEQFRVASTLTHSLPGWSTIVGFEPLKSLPLILLKFLFGIEGISQIGIDPAKLTMFLISGILMAGVFFWSLRHRKLHSSEGRFLVDMVWLSVLPIMLAWLVSFFLPILQPKRVMAAQFAVALFLPFLLTRIGELKQQLSRSIGWVSVGLLLLVQVFGVMQYWTDPRLQREDWRGVMERMYAEFSIEKTVVVFGFTDAFAPWHWYSRQYAIQFGTIAFPQMPIQEKDLNLSMARSVQYEHVLVFDYLRDVTDPDRSIETWLENTGYLGVASLDTVTFGFIRHYQRQPSALQALRFGSRMESR